MWLVLGLVSSFFLGVYDISKKISLNNNAVIPVLFLASTAGALIFIPIVILSHLGIISDTALLYISKVDLFTHFLIFLKSVLVGSSWIFAFFALKHLPITIITPIRATGPVWTLMGAIIIYGEQYNGLQWVGLITVLVFFYIFTLAGNKEGIKFRKNRWILFIVIATLLGSTSALYDKFLVTHYDKMVVQAWFSIYMIPVFLPFVLFMWYPKRKKTTPFQWRWSIPLIGILLTVADFAYFYALSDKNALITIISILRRSSVVISFTIGAIIFKDVNIKQKGVALAGILIGVIVILLAS
jgi:transporter family protein